MRTGSRYLVVSVAVAALTLGCTDDARKSRLLKKANEYFTSGDYDKAKIEYLSVVRQDPENVAAIERLATIWLEQGAPLQAAPFLFALRQISPENLDARTKLGLVFLYAGQFDEARKEAIGILDRSPSHGKAMTLLAESSVKEDQLKDAEKRLQDLGRTEQPGFHLAMATIFLRKGDPAGAEREVRAALALDPNSIEAHLASAKLASAKEDFVLSEREFKTAAQLAPARSSARIAYAEFKMRSGATNEAKEILQRVTDEAPDFLTGWRLLAQVALAEKRPDEASKLLDNTFFRDPTNIEARLVQSEVWLAQGEVRKAIEVLENLNVNYPKLQLIKLKLARAYLQDRNLSQASAVLNQALVENADYTEASLLLGEIDLRRGDAEQAAASMLNVLQRRPGLPQAQLLLAEAYRSLARLDEAAEILREQIETHPQSGPAYLLLGLVLRQQGKLDEAKRVLEAAHQLDASSLIATAQLVDLEIGRSDYESARRIAREQIDKAPDSPGGYCLEGKTYAAQGKWNEAENSLLKALDRDPANANAIDLLISTYLTANQLPKAISVLEELLSNQPKNTRALMVMAMLCEKSKDFQRARDIYERLMLLAPDSAAVLNNLAYLYAEHFDLVEEARNLAQKARTLEPINPGVADTMGWILYKRGEYQQAVDLLKESASKLSNNPEVQFHLGMALYMMGNKQGAKVALLRAVAASQDFRGKEEAQRRLSLLADVSGETTDFSSSELEAAVKQHPDDPLARMRLGEKYEQDGAFFEAAAAYEEAIKLNPNLLAAVVKLAELNSGPLNSYEKALEFAKRARKLAPDDSTVLALLGRTAYQNKNFSWSYSLLEQAARQLPNDPKVLSDLAWAAYTQGKIDEAQSLMQRVLEISQSDDAKLFITMATVNDGKADSAARQADVERILEVTPDYLPALVARARCLAEGGNLKAAAEAYSNILQSYPDFAPAHKQLASIYLEVPGKREEAYNLAMKARKALPEDPQVAEVLGRLCFERNDFAYAVQLLRQSATKKPLGPETLYCLGMSQLKTKDIVRSRETLAQALSGGLQDPLATEARQAISTLDQK